MTLRNTKEIVTELRQAYYQKIAQNRKHFVIGEIVKEPADWPGSYWFIRANAGNSEGTKPSTYDVVEHYPTGIQRTMTRTNLQRVKKIILRFSIPSSPYAYIFMSVVSHKHAIFAPIGSPGVSKTYHGIPFQNEWNPDLGGSYDRAAWEIKQDIGFRPSDKYELSTVKHELGFVRSNLFWELKHLNILESKIRWAKKSGTSIIDVLKIVNEVYV